MDHKDLFCWEIKGCAEHKRVNCVAYRASRNCWEVPGTSINSDSQAACENCPVIVSRIASAIAQAIGQNQKVPVK